MWSGLYINHEGVSAGGRRLNQANIMTDGVQAILSVLNDHQVYFRPHFEDNYGLAIYVRKGIKILDEGEIFVFKEKGHIPEGDMGKHARNLQYITFEQNGERLSVLNFHGLWNGKGKGDSEYKITDS
jgi:hypothetical protein